jgi:hypothetical protein
VLRSRALVKPRDEHLLDLFFGGFRMPPLQALPLHPAAEFEELEGLAKVPGGVGH